MRVPVAQSTFYWILEFVTVSPHPCLIGCTLLCNNLPPNPPHPILYGFACAIPNSTTYCSSSGIQSKRLGIYRATIQSTRKRVAYCRSASSGTHCLEKGSGSCKSNECTLYCATCRGMERLIDVSCLIVGKTSANYCTDCGTCGNLPESAGIVFEDKWVVSCVRIAIPALWVGELYVECGKADTCWIHPCKPSNSGAIVSCTKVLQTTFSVFLFVCEGVSRSKACGLLIYPLRTIWVIVKLLYYCTTFYYETGRA